MAGVDNTDLFAETQQETVADPNKDWASELIGEGKRYKDIQAAAKALVDKDLHIERVQGEAADLRNELRQRVTLEELLTKRNDPPADRGAEPPRVENPPAGVKPEEIADLVTNQVRIIQEQERRKNNVAKVKQELTKSLGKDYVNRLKDIANELNVTPEYLNGLAADNPTIFFKLIGNQPRVIDNTEIAPPASARAGVLPTGGTVKDWAYYQNMKKNAPKQYFSDEVQAEMHREAIKQGPSFFNK